MSKRKLKKKNIILIIVIIIIVGYFGYRALSRSENTVNYKTAVVERGTLIVLASGNGQVNTSNQVDIAPKVSGDVTYIGVKQGQIVKEGAVLLNVDSADAQIALRNAKTNLETAKLELEDLLSPVDELTLLRAENSLEQAEKTKQGSEDDLGDAYEDTFSAISNAFLKLPTIVMGIDNILHANAINTNQQNIGAYQNYIKYEDREETIPLILKMESDYTQTRTNYDQNLANYKATSRDSEKNVIENLLNETIETVKLITDIIKSERNFLDTLVDYTTQKDLRISNIIPTYQSDLRTYTSDANNLLSSLLSIQRSMQNSREAIVNAESSIVEEELILANLKDGASDFDIRAKNIVIQQKEDALLTVQKNYNDHFVTAPFDGVVAKINIKKGDWVSSNTTLVSLITQQKIAELSLNEIDIVNIEVGQKASLTFDAIEDLIISGQVIEVDSIGTTSQGVVTYDVKIVFDIDNPQVKSGMSVNADIIINVSQNALLVPNATVKMQNNFYFVQVLEPGSEVPKNQQVEVGLTNDIITEVISGLKEGDQVVTATIVADSNNTTQPVLQNKMPLQGGNIMRMMK